MHREHLFTVARSQCGILSVFIRVIRVIRDSETKIRVIRDSETKIRVLPTIRDSKTKIRKTQTYPPNLLSIYYKSLVLTPTNTPIRTQTPIIILTSQQQSEDKNHATKNL